jgi:parvulin-like peptidyl-prolyl cis-trans isomerase-like protein
VKSRVLAALGLAALLACRKPPPPPDVVAESRSGPVRMEEAEGAVFAATRAARLAGRPDPDTEPDVARYRKVAEGLVVERALLAEVPDKDRAVEALGAERDSFYRDAVLDLFHLEQDRVKPARLEAKELQAYYDAHRKDFHRPGVRLVSHLFRRDEDPDHPEKTVAFLASLKKRGQGGESFGLLAREFSQSETRLLDGRLGAVGRGRLPKSLEEVVFSLPKGGISDPIRVKGGAILLHVSDTVEEKQFPFEDVRLIIARRLWEQKRRDRVAEAIGDARPPEGSVVLDAEALRRQLESADPAEVVLQIGKRTLTVKEFKELLQNEQVEERESLPAPPLLERIRTLYDRLRQDALLFNKLEEEGFSRAAQRQAMLNERVRKRGLDLVVRKRIEELLWKKVDADPAALRRFHQENRFLYQSPLRLRVRTLTAGPGELPRQAEQMEALREELMKGQVDLEKAAQRVGGRVTGATWLEPADINAMEPKVRSYLLEMNGPGYSVPFQLNRRVNLIYVEKRDEPHLLPYEEVKERVRQEYHDRHQQDLYQQVVSDLLRAQGFRFHEEAVKRSRSVPVPRAANASP